VHQVLAGIHIVMTSEAMGFVAALGIHTSLAYDYLKAGEAGSFMFENRVPHMLVQDDKVYSALNIITKDIVSFFFFFFLFFFFCFLFSTSCTL